MLFGDLFMEFAPNLADPLSAVVGESANAMRDAIKGALLILATAVTPAGFVGALRAGARSW